MFIYRGGQKVQKGLYWRAGKNSKVVLAEDGTLPGKESALYCRLPHSCLPVLFLLLAIGVSMVLPLKTDFAIIVFLVALILALYLAGSFFSFLFGKILGRSAAFGYRPTTSYMAGGEDRKKNRHSRGFKQETTAREVER